ncbi:hypothetical protein JCGZ_16700 [Jatropha curcas]|uniref:Large ribosomal RNA subunit accumulation protein YCED homolog 2, chloroplastic n=1 Tax=Jatropha curcas TaxID=180498 RepID=A0A067K3A1_JATCU|nr:hypothetical protein JCGZ_16700 [Jatropha curcas]
MAETGHLVSSRIIKNIPRFYPAKEKHHKFLYQNSKTVLVSRRKDFTLITKKSYRNPRRLITISTADGRWHGNWTCEYLLSLRDLHLQDLIEDEQKDADISINLTIQKHAGFGLSVDGRIITSFTRKCSNCSSPYRREIDTNFNVWVLPSKKDNDAIQLPEIGGDDPSLSYLCEAWT